MSTIKVDTITTRTGSGNITLSNNVASLTSAGAISGTNLTASGTLAVTGATTLSSNVAVNGGTGGQVATNFSSASTMGMKINDTNSGNLGGMLGFYSGSGAGTLRANIQNANNAGVHFSVGTGGSIVFTQTGYTAANALDDYEEGTWTPAIGGTATYHSRAGYYIKIGQMVFITGIIHVNAVGTGAVNHFSGLPYSGTTGVGREAFIGVQYFNNLNVSATYFALRTNGTYLYGSFQNAADGVMTVNPNFITASTEVAFAGSYYSN